MNPLVDGPHLTLMCSIFRERFQLGAQETPPMLEEFEFAKRFWEIS